MEHAEEADLGAEVPGIASDLEQGRGAGVEQQVINQPLVLQGKWGQFAREGEDDMHVAGGEQLALGGLRASAQGRCPDILGNADYGTNSKRWRNVHSWSTDRDVRPAPRCGNG